MYLLSLNVVSLEDNERKIELKGMVGIIDRVKRTAASEIQLIRLLLLLLTDPL